MERCLSLVDQIKAVFHKIFVGFPLRTAAIGAPMKLASYARVISKCGNIILDFIDAVTCHRKPTGHHESGVSAAGIAKEREMR